MDLNIRGVPSELVAEMKVEAARRGMSLKGLVLDVLKKGIEASPEGEDRVPAKKSVSRGRGGRTEPAAPTNSGAAAASPDICLHGRTGLCMECDWERRSKGRE